VFPLGSLELKTLEEDAFLGRYTIEPLHPGYGIMIGNSLRRVLLASIEGAAPIAIKIEGVPHEFSVIEGVVEDVVQIVLNIKKLVVAMDNDDVRTITLDVSGERVVTAADIITDAGVTIINPELHIAELSSSKSTLRMDILVSKGRGYVPTEKNKRQDYPIGTIWLDSMFTPVKNVRFNVEQTLIEQYLDFEKLSLDILCNGAVLPKSALDQALQILGEYYTSILNPEMLRLKETSLEETLEEKLALTIDMVMTNLSPKIQHTLVYAGVKTMRDLLMKSHNELLTIHGMSSKSLAELSKSLEETPEYATFSQFNFPFFIESKEEVEEKPAVKREEPVEEDDFEDEEEDIIEEEKEPEPPKAKAKVEKPKPEVEKPKTEKPEVKTEPKKAKEPEPKEQVQEEKKPEIDITKGFTLPDISLAKSTMTFLQQNKITNLKSLLICSKSKIESLPGFKPKIIIEIEKNLDKVGLQLAPDETFSNLSKEELLKAVSEMAIGDFEKEIPSISKAEIKSINSASITNVGQLMAIGKKGLKGQLKLSSKTIEDIDKRLTKWGLELKE
jgi:DNA-directed RNA polymerase subunit alpha